MRNLTDICAVDVTAQVAMVFTVHLTYSGLPLICTVCSLLIKAAKFTVDRGRGHHHHTLVAFASGDITLMSNHPSPRVNSCCQFLSLSSPLSRGKNRGCLPYLFTVRGEPLPSPRVGLHLSRAREQAAVP